MASCGEGGRDLPHDLFSPEVPAEILCCRLRTAFMLLLKWEMFVTGIKWEVAAGAPPSEAFLSPETSRQQRRARSQVRSVPSRCFKPATLMQLFETHVGKEPHQRGPDGNDSKTKCFHTVEMTQAESAIQRRRPSLVV